MPPELPELAAAARIETGRRAGAVRRAGADVWPDPPRQLPAAVRHFAGRSAEQAALDGLLVRNGVVVVAGTAGVGKTALAVHWAHRVADRFPDGQLHVNLRGFGSGGVGDGSGRGAGRIPRRAGHCARPVELSRQLGDRYEEADFLTRLGDAHNATGDRMAARRAWTRALDIFQELGHAEADTIRAKMLSPPSPATTP